MRHQDLSLLIVFDAIMTEGSITRAADRLSMTQPAVSNAVSRMRLAWKDELFIKNGRNIRPTLHAHNLWPQIREPLKKLGEAVSPIAFDPATAQRTFHIASADVGIDMVWKPLRKIIEQQAPNINIYAIPYTLVNGEELLNDAEVDLVFGPMGTVPGRISSDPLFNAKCVCVMRADHPLAQKPLSMEEFTSADHLMVTLSGDAHAPTDEVLEQQGASRRIAMTVNHFSSIASLLIDSDLIAVTPSIAVEKEIFSGKLAVLKTPVDIPEVLISCFWHKRQGRDPGVIWLREHMSNIIKEHCKRHYIELDSYLNRTLPENRFS